MSKKFSVRSRILCFILLAASPLVAQRYSDHYSLPFGDNPYFPSRATAEFTEFLKPTDFPAAEYCGKCHAQVHKEWRESAHANSFREPFYLKNVQMLIAEKGIEYSRHCEGCHNPVALFSGALTPNSSVDRSFDNDGITCSVCHSIRKIEANAGTGSYVMGQPAVMLNPDGSPRAGLPSYSEIFDNPELHRKAVMPDFLRSPEFCSVCHKAAIPKELDGYKWLRAFSVYDEWQQSSWSKQSPLPFYSKEDVSTCQSCHMPSREAAGEYAAIEGKLRSHRFAGANSAIPTFYSYGDQLRAVKEFLQNAVSVDLFGLSISHKGHTNQIVPLGNSPFHLSRGDEVTVDVVIQNTRAGHSLVPEQRDFYQSWVEFLAQDERGTVVFHSGGTDAAGMLDPDAHSYTNRLIDKQGSRIALHQVWRTRLKTYDNTIMPGRSDLVRYKFRVPSNVSGKIIISAKVNYRRFRKQYSDFVLGGSKDYPIFELGSKAVALQIGRNDAATPFQNREQERQTQLRRWNNYGIALLGQQQWWAAADAFAQVTRLDPGYVDGYINQAIAEYSKWIESRREDPDGPGVFALDNANAPPEKFEAALGLLSKALALAPGSARALFYRGVILRLQNHPEEAIKELVEVVQQYPKLRQGHQDLGYALYLKKDFARSAEQFEQVKTINPDDVTAFYYLAIDYTRLGNTIKASENAKLYSEHRNDPNNYRLNVDFVKANPPEARELTPYHIHGK